ncbi:hypothetical protein GCM10010392_62110 [Streptomyces clavifer]|nr:hypothetical protein GCM10010392_62110 [Streptomyces clavifer]
MPVTAADPAFGVAFPAVFGCLAPLHGQRGQAWLRAHGPGIVSVGRRPHVAHTHVRTQSVAALQGVGFLVTEWLPVRGKREVPSPESGRPPGAGVSKWLDQLLAQASELIDDRAESRRVDPAEPGSRVHAWVRGVPATVTGVAARHPGDADVFEAMAQGGHAAPRSAGRTPSPRVLRGERPGRQRQDPPAGAASSGAAPAAPDHSVPVQDPAAGARHGPPPEPHPPAAEQHRGLPRRRSRHDGLAPAVEEAPTAATPPGSPEDAGDWMEQFFEGGRSALPAVAAAPATGTAPTGSVPSERTPYGPRYGPSPIPRKERCEHE